MFPIFPFSGVLFYDRDTGIETNNAGNNTNRKQNKFYSMTEIQVLRQLFLLIIFLLLQFYSMTEI